MKKRLYLALASLSIALGTLGIFVPLLPTTPFLLLAAYFYMNSSKKHLRWLLNHKYLGPYITSYISKRGIPVKVMVRTLILLWSTIIATIIFATDKPFVRILLIIVACGVTIHIASKRSTRRTNKKEGSKQF